MKVTQAAKRATRKRILAEARAQFIELGFEATTTRGLAAGADIAKGTLFNYFESKEALAATLVADALAAALEDFGKRLQGDEDLGEQLFLHISTGFRRLEPYRGFVGAVLETALSPFAKNGVSSLGDELRMEHLDVVRELTKDDPLDVVRLHLYWTLYLGVAAFWAADDSPNQEDTLAILDESLRVFALSLSDQDGPKPPRS